MDTNKDDRQKLPTDRPAKPSKSLVIANKEAILTRLAEGDTVTKIAKSLGLTHAAISMQLANDPEYQAAKVIHHATRLDRAESDLELSQDSFTLARAREVHKAYSWRASVECSRLWGTQQQAQTTFGQGGITINIGTVDGVTIDGEAVKD